MVSNRVCYAANSRPDALMKDQLVEMTGLSPRVVRVWFQNKRFKEKMRARLLKQEALLHDKVRKIGDYRVAHLLLFEDISYSK